MLNCHGNRKTLSKYYYEPDILIKLFFSTVKVKLWFHYEK